MIRKERAIKNLKQMCSDGRYLGSESFAPLEVLEDFSLAIKALEQELNPIAIVKIKYDEDKLKELVDKAVFTTVIPQEPKSEWEHDHEILKAYSDGANEVLDKIYADIQKLRGCSCSCSDGIIDDVEDILDKYKGESEDKNNELHGF